MSRRLVETYIVPVQCADKCVLDSCRYLQQRGFDVTYLPVGKDGLLNLEELQAAFRPDTALVSVMTVNNEIGAHLIYVHLIKVLPAELYLNTPVGGVVV